MHHLSASRCTDESAHLVCLPRSRFYGIVTTQPDQERLGGLIAEQLGRLYQDQSPPNSPCRALKMLYRHQPQSDQSHGALETVSIALAYISQYGNSNSAEFAVQGDARAYHYQAGNRRVRAMASSPYRTTTSQGHLLENVRTQRVALYSGDFIVLLQGVASVRQERSELKSIIMGAHNSDEVARELFESCALPHAVLVVKFVS